MVFKKVLSALGVGAPSVDTVLTNPNTRPGLHLDGHVNLTGGTQPADLEHIAVSLVTVVEVEHEGGEQRGEMQFHSVAVAGPMPLAAGQQVSIPFTLPVPWETPITEAFGGRLPGMTVGLRTEVAIARAVDRGDLDQVRVYPLPVQEQILDAFARLGFRLVSADLEYGRIHGVNQSLPFYQEIEFYAAPQYAHQINQVELTFVTGPQAVEVVLEFDKRGGLFGGGHDTFGRYTVRHEEAGTVDWVSQVDGWIRQAIGHRHPTSGYPTPGHPRQSFDHYHGHHHRHGGIAGAAMGAAGGFLGGLIAGEILGDVFGGDDSGEDSGE